MQNVSRLEYTFLKSIEALSTNALAQPLFFLLILIWMSMLWQITKYSIIVGIETHLWKF